VRVQHRSTSAIHCSKHLILDYFSLYSKTATVAKAEKAFAATGIFPFNPDVTIEDEFAPSYVTDRNPDDVHQLPKMPDGGTADAKATGRTIMTNESGYVTSLRIQSSNHDSSATSDRNKSRHIGNISPSEMHQGEEEEESSTEVSGPFMYPL
jgi:hypothetical protein